MSYTTSPLGITLPNSAAVSSHALSRSRSDWPPSPAKFSPYFAQNSSSSLRIFSLTLALCLLLGLQGSFCRVQRASVSILRGSFGGWQRASLIASKSAVSCSRSLVPSCRRPAMLTRVLLRVLLGIGPPSQTTLSLPA